MASKKNVFLSGILCLFASASFAQVQTGYDVKDSSLFSEIMQLMVTIIKTRGWAESNYKIITNGGSYQSTPHLHFHLVSGAPLDPANAAQRGEVGV